MASTEQRSLTATDVRMLLDLERALGRGAALGPPMADIFIRLRTAFYRSLPYDVYLLTAHWQETREMALRAYPPHCRWCAGAFGDDAPIHIHHLSYERLGHEDIRDLIPLCAPCHERWHREEGAR